VISTNTSTSKEPAGSSAQGNPCATEEPYWSYGDLGVFLLAAAALTLVLRVLVRLHVLSTTEFIIPSDAAQIAITLVLSATLYLILKLRYRRAVVRSIGWRRPKAVDAFASVGIGVALALAVLLYQDIERYGYGFAPSWRLLMLSSVFAPVLEESLFRGCLLPLISRTTGNACAVVLTAGAFALFHGPTDLAHWISFTITGIAYGWIRVISGTATAAGVAHATYNAILVAVAALSTYL
jgi:membrane protease YdiL (CAAX protease family)